MAIRFPTRDITLLDPQLRVLAEKFLSDCRAAGIDAFITQTYRSTEYQNTLFAQGRTTEELRALGITGVQGRPGPRVTNARGGTSAHNFTKDGKPWARAFDIAIKNPDGSLNWNAETEPWKRAGAIGEAVGLEWGGSWTRFKDASHFQLRNWKTLP